MLQAVLDRMKVWYKDASNRSPPTESVTIARIMMELVDLHWKGPSLGENIPVLVEPFAVNNTGPEEDEIEWAVKKL